MRKKEVVILLDGPQLDALNKLAAKDQRSRASVVRDAIARYLAERAPPPDLVGRETRSNAR